MHTVIRLKSSLDYESIPAVAGKLRAASNGETQSVPCVRSADQPFPPRDTLSQVRELSNAIVPTGFLANGPRASYLHPLRFRSCLLLARFGSTAVAGTYLVGCSRACANRIPVCYAFRSCIRKASGKQRLSEFDAGRGC